MRGSGTCAQRCSLLSQKRSTTPRVVLTCWEWMEQDANSQQPTTNNTGVYPKRALSFCVCTCSMDRSAQPVTGAAQRRKQRRLRSWWRHEQQSIAASLATFQYHSSLGLRKARVGRGGERVELHGRGPDDSSSQPVLFSLYDEEPGGWRPASLVEPPGPQERGPCSRRSCPSRLSMFLCCRWLTNRWISCRFLTSRCPSRLLTCPRSLWTPPRSARCSLSRSWRSSWLKCLSLSPPSTTGSNGRRPRGPQASRGWVGLTGVRSLRGEPPPVQGGILILGQDLVDAPGTAQPQFQLIDRVVEIRGRGCPNSFAQCKLCSSGECGVNCSDKFQRFLVGCERPCDLQRGIPGSAVLCSTVDTHSASARETFRRVSGFST